MEKLPHFQPTYEHKHWHWLLRVALFVVAVFVGGFVYYFYLQDSSTDDSQVSVPTAINHQTLDATSTPVQLIGLDEYNNPEPSYFWKDANHAYWGFEPAQVIEDTDADSFTLVGNSLDSDLGHMTGSYAKDKTHVYFSDSESFVILDGADPTTFRLNFNRPTYDALDKNHEYLQGQIVE